MHFCNLQHNMHIMKFKSNLKSIVFKIRHNDDDVIVVANARLHGYNTGLTTVHCKCTTQLTGRCQAAKLNTRMCQQLKCILLSVFVFLDYFSGHCCRLGQVPNRPTDRPQRLQKQCGLMGLLCRWPSITEWEMYITAQGSHLQNYLYCVEWDIKL